MTNTDTILVVDDTRGDLQLLAIILTRAGYRVRTAESGKLALAAVDEELPALILLDVRMPGMDGFAVCRHLKERQETRDIPVIFISVSTDIEDHVRGFQLGGVDFITKPFKQDELLARVQTHLNLCQVQHQLELQTAELLKANEHLQVENEERKQAEAQRILLEDQVRHQQRLETVGQLAAGVAHDFNNILTGITGFTQFALDSLPAAGATHEDLTEVLTLAKRAADITHQLLAFSRRQPLQLVVLNINELTSNMAKMLGRLLGENLNMRFNLAADLGAVKVDPGQFEQVLVNLAVNARDAMPDGGMLTIETANVELDEEYARVHSSAHPGSYVMLAVTDSGCGIDTTIINHIFEPFFTTNEIGKGTGLGLATVYGIVKQHGGNIWVYSELGCGTTFKVYLPLVHEELCREPATVPATSINGTETILIVEDSPTVLIVAQEILMSFGYHVLTAALPSLAEIVLAEHGDTIALMLTDIMMPECNGHQLYESVHARFPRLRVLYMSGYPADVIAHQGELDSDTAFIQKPFTANALGQKVREVLDSAK